MRRLSGTDSPALGIALLALAPLGFACWALHLGQDCNWDLKNYHFYNVTAWLYDRYGLDFAPGYRCSYYNPTLFVPHILGMRYLSPRALAVLTAAFQGTVVVPVYWFGQKLVPIAQNRWRSLVAAGLAIVGALGALTMSELGTSFVDSAAAIIALVGMALCLLGNGDEAVNRGDTQWRCAAGGAVLGLLTGVRLQSIVYGFGVAVSLGAVQRGPLRDRVRLWLTFGGAYATGVVAGILPWALTMWRHFGNPLFPFFNGIFRSPNASTLNVYMPAEYLPQGPLHWLFWPFVAIADWRLANDLPFFDLRWPLLYAVAILAAAARLAGRPWSRSPLLPGVLIAFGATYGLVLARFTRYRYALGIEVMAPLLTAVLVLGFLGLRRSVVISLVVALALVVITTRPTDWGRIPFGSSHLGVPELNLPNNASLLVAGRNPTAYLVDKVPPSVPIWRITPYGDSLYDPDTGVALREPAPGDDAFRERLHTLGPLYLASSPIERETAKAALQRYGLTISGHCREARSHVEKWLPILLCPLQQK